MNGCPAFGPVGYDVLPIRSETDSYAQGEIVEYEFGIVSNVEYRFIPDRKSYRRGGHFVFETDYGVCAYSEIVVPFAYMSTEAVLEIKPVRNHGHMPLVEYVYDATVVPFGFK